MELNEEEEKEVDQKLKLLLKKHDLVIVVDYGHGLLTKKIIKTLESGSSYLAVNTQLNSFNQGYHSISKYKQADYVCVHSGELRYDYRDRLLPIED